jgi:hypothetical protein
MRVSVSKNQTPATLFSKEQEAALCAADSESDNENDKDDDKRPQIAASLMCGSMSWSPESVSGSPATLLQPLHAVETPAAAAVAVADLPVAVAIPPAVIVEESAAVAVEPLMVAVVVEKAAAVNTVHASSSSKDKALSNARKQVPVFLAMPSFEGAVSMSVRLQGGGKDCSGQFTRHMCELVSLMTTSVPMPIFTPEFGGLRVASQTCEEAMLRLVSDASTCTRQVREKHVCYSFDDGARRWSVASCTTLGSFVFAQLDDDVVQCAVGVYGTVKTGLTLVSTASEVHFGDVPHVIRLLAAWFVATLNVSSIRVEATLHGEQDIVDCLRAIQTRKKTYVCALGRVRNAGSAWTVANKAKLKAEGEEGLDANKRERKRKPCSSIQTTRDRKKGKTLIFNDDDDDDDEDDDDGIDKEQRRLLGLARQAARLKNAVLIAMLTGKKVSLRRHV